MTLTSDHASWCAIELGPNAGRGWAARGWAMQGDTMKAAHRIESLSARPGIAVAKELVQALCPGVPAVICGLADGPEPIAVPAKPASILPVPLEQMQAHALPGLRQDTPPGLMRAGAVRVAGFLALNPGWDGVICLPGPVTHWVQVSADEVVSFLSALTGEIASALATASSLRPALEGDGWDSTEFGAALDSVLSRPERLATGLATIQTGTELGTLRPGQARAQLFGLLTGAELAAARPYWLGQQVALIGTDTEARPYAEALQRQGVPTTIANEARMTLAGLTAAWRLIKRAG
ncbi:MAG: 2-dehydro-3-deoxygalactonokinase [Pseudodonghicola sp.]|nr:2-dehydro-3-deoxygalactonokinase [Pseudodonghicola sp.]